MATILFSGHMADPVNADPILMLFCADIKQLVFHSNMVADQAAWEALCMIIRPNISVIAE